MQCPLNNIIAFIDGGFSWVCVVDVDCLYITTNLLMNARTFFLIQMTIASVMCSPVLKNLLWQADKIFHYVAHNCALQILSSPWPLGNLLSSSSLLCRRRGALWRHLKDCINGSSQYLHVPHEARLFSLLLNERFALGLGQLRLGRRL